ncbi:Endoplasmic reticulum-Golgi intermediate compartment protein 3, partial [Entomortierella beljakovae]
MRPTESKFSRISQFDAYAKTLDDFRVKTSTGATVTLVCVLVVFYLFVSEVSNYRTINRESSLVVDSGIKERMSISLNITFPSIPCYVLTLDAMDAAGEHQSDIVHSIYKIQLSPDGSEIAREKTKKLGQGSDDDVKPRGENYCGSCYGAKKPESGCCNTCEEIRAAYAQSGWSFKGAGTMEQCVQEGYLEKLKEQADQGCRIWGELIVSKVSGNVHVAPGKSFQHGATHLHDVQQYLSQGLNFSHYIDHLSFGEITPMTHNPLDGWSVINNEKGLYMYQYFLKVVGLQYIYLDREPAFTNQYSVTQYNKNLQLNGFGTPNGLP